MIKSIVVDLQSYLIGRKEKQDQLEYDLTQIMCTADYRPENISSYNQHATDYTIFLQSQYLSVPRVKHYLESLVHTGEELGVYGLFLAGDCNCKYDDVFQCVFSDCPLFSNPSSLYT
jgi:hypothetical protein